MRRSILGLVGAGVAFGVLAIVGLGVECAPLVRAAARAAVITIVTWYGSRQR